MLDRKFPLSRTQSDYAQLMKARRMATRQRAATACLPCKAKKAKCNDYRPCARCSLPGGDNCMDGVAFWTESSSLVHSNQPTAQSPSSFVFSPSREYRLVSEAHAMITMQVRAFSADRFATNGLNVPACSQSDHQDFKRKIAQISVEHFARDQHSLQTRPSTTNTARVSFNNCMQWAWEAASGPGNEDPFQDDLKKCQLLWMEDDSTSTWSGGKDRYACAILAM